MVERWGGSCSRKAPSRLLMPLPLLLYPQPRPAPSLQLPLLLQPHPVLLQRPGQHLRLLLNLRLPLNLPRHLYLLRSSPIMVLLACIALHGHLAGHGLLQVALAQKWKSGVLLLEAISSLAIVVRLKFIVWRGRPMVHTSFLVTRMEQCARGMVLLALLF